MALGSPRERGIRFAIGYALPSLVAAVVTVGWFSPGRFFAAGDVPPYLRDNLAAELGGVWNHQLSGAGSASYAIVGAPDVALLALARAVGAAPVAAQQLLYAGGAGLAAFGSAYLAGAWTGRAVPRAAAGLVGAFNVFLLVSYPNVLPALTVGLTGTLAGLVLRGARRGRVRGSTVALVSLPLGYLARSPALLVVAGLGVLGAAAVGALAGGPGAPRRIGALLSRALGWAAPLHLWWLVPFALTLMPVGAATFSAQTDVLSWAWSHARTGLANVLTLNGQWGWDDPDLYPYAPALSGGAGPMLRWLVPVLAAFGVLAAGRRRRTAAWLLAGGILVVAALGTGTHPPLGGANLWLYQHLPGAWLFRDPMSKLGVLLVLGYASLAALAIERMLRIGRRRLSWALRAAAAMVLAAILAYPAPLWTGQVAASSRGQLAGARVAVPPEWYQLADRLNTDPQPGKVVILPLDPYYQVQTDWGYAGVDEVPAQLVRRPVLRLLPGGYFAPGAGVAALLLAVQRNLLAGDGVAAAAQLRALGASHVVVRRDLRGGVYALRPADPGPIGATLAAMPAATRLAVTAVGALYRLDPAPPLSAGARLIRSTADASGTADAVGRVGAVGPVTAGGAAPPGDALEWHTDQTAVSDQIRVDRAGRYMVSRPPSQPVRYLAQVVHRGGQAQLRLTDADELSLDAIALPARPPLSVPLGGVPVAVSTGSAMVPIAAGVPVLALGAPTTVTVYGVARSGRAEPAPAGVELTPIGHAVLAAPPAPVVTRELSAGWHQITLRGPGLPGAAGLSACDATGVHRFDPATVELAATGTTACVHTAALVPQPPSRYRVSFEVHSGTGVGARACVWQEGPDRCVDLVTLPTATGWHRVAMTFAVQPGTRRLTLYLYADGLARPVRVGYRKVRLAPAAGASLLLTAEPSGPAPQFDVDRGVVRVHGASGPFLLTLAESYSPGWRVGGLPPGWTATQRRVDGYANGWLVAGRGDATLRVEYRPAIWAVAAIVTSVVAAAVAVGWLLVGAVRRRRARPGPATASPVSPGPVTTGPLVSIVVPTRDSAELMRRLLLSCRRSTYPNLEVVINDDPRSRDRMADVVTRFRADGLSISYLTENISMSAGRAVGARHSRGEILLHLDADMQLEPELVGECVRLVGAGADALVIPEESFGTTFWARCKWLEKRCYAGVGRIESLRAITRDCYQAVGGHNPNLVFSEDKDLDLRVRAAGYRLARTRARLRHDEGQLTLRTSMAKKRRYAATARAFAREHPGHFAWQANVFYRYALYLRRIDLLARHPLRYLGLLLLKTAEAAAVASGLLAFRADRKDDDVSAALSRWEKFRLLRRTIRNWPLVLPDKLGLVYRCRYRTRTGETFLCRPRSTDINELVVMMSGHEYPAEYARVPAGGVIVDLGAYIGDSAVYFDRLNRDTGYVGYAIEPAPGNLALLRANLRLNGVRDFEVVPAAISDVDGEVEIDLGSQHDAIALTRSPGGTPVPSYRLSTFAASRQLERIDVLKMDIEGAEYTIIDSDYEFVVKAVARLVMEYHAQPSGYGLDWLRARTGDDFALHHIHRGQGSGVIVLDNVRLLTPMWSAPGGS